MSHWRKLLDRTIIGLEKLRLADQPVPDWIFGGGTAMMLQTQHRLSKDIDAFIDDPAYLPLLSPRLGGEEVWLCDQYDESSNYLKLVFPEGEIDFIVAREISDLPAMNRTFPSDGGLSSCSAILEHPVETALKKINYRSKSFKVRDAFDVCVVSTSYEDLLASHLHLVRSRKSDLLERIDRMNPEYFAEEIALLDIFEKWQPVAKTALERIKEIALAIPDNKPRP